MSVADEFPNTCSSGRNHILADMSFDDVNSKVASDEKIAEFKTSSCPAKVCKHVVVVVLQILAVSSSDAVNTRQQSCENTAVAIPFVWPTDVIRHVPVVVLHIFIAESTDAARREALRDEAAVAAHAVLAPTLNIAPVSSKASPFLHDHKFLRQARFVRS